MHHRLRQLSLLAALVAVALVAAPAASGPAATVSCENSSIRPMSGNLSKVRKATRCLINAERTQRGRKALVDNSKLAKAAQSHAKDMVRRRYFDHVSPGGKDPGDRIEAAGYKSSALAENIAYGGGEFGTPSSIVKSWMKSKGHRKNILSKDYTEFGMGVAFGLPEGSGSGGTYVNTFGTPR